MLASSGEDFLASRHDRQRLAQAISLALTDAEMRREAAELGAAIRGEPDEVAEAVKRIEEIALIIIFAPAPERHPSA